jgi:hypothetical protein
MELLFPELYAPFVYPGKVLEFFEGSKKVGIGVVQPPPTQE